MKHLRSLEMFNKNDDRIRTCQYMKGLYPELNIQLSLICCHTKSLTGCRDIPIIDSCRSINILEDLGNNDKIILSGMHEHLRLNEFITGEL
jgi:hypothetical protein